jgi:redox-sensitive bicupin YhaK (pirin superfamily)
LRGFQVWINLPASEKMSEPAYQEFDAARMPVESRIGARVKVIAGTTETGVSGPVLAPNVDARYFDIELAPGGAFSESVPEEHHAFFALYEGEATAPSEQGSQSFRGLNLLSLGPGDKVELRGGPAGARALLLAARPLNEPVAWSGPFVMNTREELMQAHEDYRQGRF